MPWVSKRELARIARERAAAEKRALSAERRLDDERRTSRRYIERLVDHIVTMRGGYAVSDPEPRETAEPANQKVPVSPEESHARAQFLADAAAAGIARDKALRDWDTYKTTGVQPWELLGQS
jgi:hypothetical protein